MIIKPRFSYLSKRKIIAFFGIIALFVALLSINYYLNFTRSNFSGSTSAHIIGNTYYVSPTGSDDASGTSEQPFGTIAHAVSLSGAGDVIYLKPGTYQEHLSIVGRNGEQDKPITIIGESTNPAEYPILDGGDPDYTSRKDAPVLTFRDSSWFSIERLRFKNLTETGVYLENSHYITFRRNHFAYHGIALKAKQNTSHLLVEYNDFTQSLPSSYTWSSLKNSKYEGGAYVSYGADGMSIFRYNYFHDMFNAIYMYSADSGTGIHNDANVWIYRNRFENIVDDPYEPETYAFNHHFFHNTIINSHRIVSLAPDQRGLVGPIYVYGNIQLITHDPTNEATSGRLNSAVKLDLNSSYYSQGAYFFQNSIDSRYPATNSYGLDVLDSTVRSFSHYNNAYRTLNDLLSTDHLTPVNTVLDSDISQASFGGVSEPNGQELVNPGFTNSAQEDFRLLTDSPARKAGQAINLSQGFSSPLSISPGDDLGAYRYGESDFRSFPSPQYLVPPEGEVSSFPANVPWPQDIFGGENPLSGPVWAGTIIVPPLVDTPPASSNPTPTPTLTPTPTPTPTATPTPTDQTPPLLSFISPLDQELIPSKSQYIVRVEASDASGIDYVEFYLNGKRKYLDSSYPYEYPWRVSPKSNVEYLLKAIAVDLAGNTSSAQIQVTSK